MTESFKGLINTFLTEKLPKLCKCSECCKNMCSDCKDSDFKYKIYNEYSLQHELGNYLTNSGYNVFYEKNVREFLDENDADSCIKKEVDLIAKKGNKYYAIELKFPKNGQYPEEMFQFLKDIYFMEQIKAYWEATQTYCLTLVNNKNFYEGSHCENGGKKKNYRYFRRFDNNIFPIHGHIENHIVKKNYKGQIVLEAVDIKGEYTIEWMPEKSDKNLKYYFLPIK